MHFYENPFTFGNVYGEAIRTKYDDMKKGLLRGTDLYHITFHLSNRYRINNLAISNTAGAVNGSSKDCVAAASDSLPLTPFNVVISTPA
jgi:hypothetical protein